MTLLLLCLATISCANNENSHTTAVTYVSPPPVQRLTIVSKPIIVVPQNRLNSLALSVDPTKPFLVFNLEDKKTFRVGDEVTVEVLVENANLKNDGGEYRVRYIVDDDDARWIDKLERLRITGWIPGKHTIRVELIGPDGWPYKNGNANIVTKEIMVVP